MPEEIKEQLKEAIKELLAEGKLGPYISTEQMEEGVCSMCCLHSGGGMAAKKREVKSEGEKPPGQ